MALATVPKAVGLVYALAGILALAYLWHTGWFSRRRGLALLGVTALLGFLIFSPVAPYQFQLLVLRDAAGLGAPVLLAAAGLAVMLGLALLFGRIFCGHFCPVGALQEIAAHLYPKKVWRTEKRASMAVRWAVFVVFFASGVLLSFNLIGGLGVHDLFHLVGGVPAGIFLGILALSVAVYRPFCRFVCPYGALLAVASSESLYRFVRTDLCINCGRCERACPTDEAKRGDAKAECYMCGRCVEACPVEGALHYARR